MLNHHCDDESTTTIRISGTSIAVVEERWGRRPGQKKRVLSGKKKVLCTECGRWVAEHKNGLPRAHGYGRCKMRCRGSAITGDGR